MIVSSNHFARRSVMHGDASPSHRLRRRGYLLLETVIATGMLITGLAVIAAQVQGSHSSVKEMRRRIHAMMLAESQLAMLDLGLVELESFDEVEEGDFGPRYPDFGWEMTTEETAIPGVFLIQLDVLHSYREGDYSEDSFEFDEAESVYALYAQRVTPLPLDLGLDFGVPEEQLEEISEKLAVLGVEGLDAQALDPTILAKLDFEQFLEILPVLADAMGIDLTDALGALPPDLKNLLGDDPLLVGLGGDDADSGQREAP